MNKYFTVQEIKQLKEIQNKISDILDNCNDIFETTDERNVETMYVIIQSVLMTENLLSLIINDELNEY